MTFRLIQQYTSTDSLTQYGDGVFETMLGVGDTIHHWKYHWARLQRSCERLQISVPDHDVLYVAIQTELGNTNHDFSVMKMIVSRGEGLRGYRSQPKQPCFVQFSVAPYAFNLNLYSGLNVRICGTRLAQQPLLAGMKHCNRLEYVMARREAEDGLFDEGLLLDYDDCLIEGLISNVFLMTGTQITTPSLNNSGVEGTMRSYLLETLPSYGYTTNTTQLVLDDILQADAVFLSNATNGVMPVRTVQGINKAFDIAAVETIRQLTNHPSVRY